MKKYDILVIKENDIYELPVAVCDSIEDASKVIGCSIRTLYNTMHTKGIMKANGYYLELVNRENK